MFLEESAVTSALPVKCAQSVHIYLSYLFDLSMRKSLSVFFFANFRLFIGRAARAVNKFWKEVELI